MDKKVIFNRNGITSGNSAFVSSFHSQTLNVVVLRDLLLKLAVNRNMVLNEMSAKVLFGSMEIMKTVLETIRNYCQKELPYVAQGKNESVVIFV